MPRAIWTGSVGFGLVQIPVALHTAEDRADLDMPRPAWLLFQSRDEEATTAPAKAKAKTKAAKPAKIPARSVQPPQQIQPELATLVDDAPPGDDWVHEIKFDGYRMLARIAAGKVSIFTRNGKDWTARVPTLRAALEQLNVDSAVLDGELVALDAKGISSFQGLQNALSEGRDAALVYYAFDLLHLDGRDLTGQPLLERKSNLRELLEQHTDALGGAVRLSAHVVGSGPEFFANAGKLGLEGTIAKRASSPYRAGRGRDWLKIKCNKSQEFTVIGYTEPAGSRSHLGALLLGVERDGKLSYAGRVGTGFSEASLAELAKKLAPLASKQPAVVNPPTGVDARGVHWVKPRLVAEVRFVEMTQEGLLRHPTFQGLRDDKPASEVKLEVPSPMAAKKAPARYPISNPDKVLYPELGITKLELLEYYELVAAWMLPQVANRPLTLVRCPNGWGKSCFFQKHPGEGAPPGLRSISIREKEGKAPYSVIDEAEGLFGLVQLGALEIHTWGSRADDFEHPDILVFDLDPDEKLGYDAVIRGARQIRQIFESAKLESFVKTTGGKGLHVCIPIAPDLGWDVVKGFTGSIAEAMAKASPELYVATQSKAKRTGKTFVDYLRNGRGATFIAPYSTRARENAPIAVPLEWDELSPKVPPNHFNVRNIGARLAKLKHDPWQKMTRAQALRPDALGSGLPRKPSKKRA